MSETEVNNIVESSSSSTALLRIRETIEKEGNDEINRINEDAEKQITEILENAKREADFKAKQIIEDAKKMATLKKQREVSRVSLQTKLEVLRYKEGLIRDLVEELKANLSSFTNKSEYVEILKNYTKVAAASIGGGDLVVKLRKQDSTKITKSDLEALAKEVENMTGQPTQLELSSEYLTGLGGVEVSTKDGAIIATNTFEEIIDRKIDVIRKIAYEKL